ncbi:MAG: hypothetical protein A2017_03455 [Lentisphaerae bacterium GWF2_44_16]|nr:MAG: hypothetical protein A2017_03455 [Lentisphaerae bacterium GWF2_44_16]
MRLNTKFLLMAAGIAITPFFSQFATLGEEKCCEKKLFDFKSQEDLEKWTTKQGAEVSISEKDGRKCARVFFPKYKDLETRWPGFLISKKGLPSDWKSYDRIVFNVFFASATSSEFSVLIIDKNDKKYYEKPVVFPGKWTSVSIKINKDWLDAGNIKELNIYQSHPPFERTFYIDSIRLESSIPEKIKALAAKYEKIGEKEKASLINSIMEKLEKSEIMLDEAVAEYGKFNSALRDEQKNFLRKQFAKYFPSGKFAVTQLDSMDKVLPQAMEIKAESAASFKISIAKNEFEAVQALILSPENEDIKNLSVEIQPFKLEKNPDVVFKPENIKASPLGFVETKKTRSITDYTGFYPDPILEFMNEVNVEKGEIQPYWIRFKTDGDTKAGIYKGAFVFKSRNAGNVTIPAEIKVWNFELPKTGHLKFATSVYGSGLIPDGNKEKFYDYILNNYRMNPFSIYNDSAYGKPLFPEIEDYIKRKPMGLNFIPILYLKLPRQALHKCSPSESKEKWANMPSEERKHYPEEWKKKLLGYLDKRVPELKKAGLWDISYCYGFDEANPTEWDACAELCSAIKEKYPDIKIISTAYDQSYGTDSVMGKALTGWIPTASNYNYSLAEKVRKTGKQVWWYDTDMTIDRDKLADIRAQLGSRSFANNVDGFLVWTVNRWYSNKIPIINGPYTKWNPDSCDGTNGGGSYFCAGPNGSFLPTMRAEAMRDGLEDYEYFYLLKKLFSELKGNNPLKKDAENILSSLKKEEGIKSEELRELRENTGDLIEKILKQSK